jgi:Virulence-associated protein E/Bifunctional DNA primase/polymerase, N-terminal
MRRQTAVLDIALQYLALGWMPIPVPHREKNPGFQGWEDCRLDTPEKLAQHFNGKPQNIGVLLGEPSNHTIDVDLDFVECLPFARIFLPSTRQFGRRTNPVSHWLYTVVDAPNRTLFVSSRITDDGKKADTVLEIRGTRHQTIFPTSIHKDTGEEILWVGQQPLHKIAFAELQHLCGRVAAGAVLARYWPRTKGNRHHCALALAGLLLRADFTVDEAERFIGAIAKIAGNDEEAHTNTVKATKAALDAGKKVTGWKRLYELLNIGKPIENIPTWLGYVAQSSEAATEDQPERGEENSDEPDLDTPDKSAFANLNNAVKVLEQDPDFCRVWFDEFLQRIRTGDPTHEWKDADDIHLQLRFQREKRIPRMGLDTVRSAVTEIAFRNRKNCVKDWLESLRWDGEERLQHFFEDHYGVDGTLYHRAASKNFLVSMVARIYKPGCQSDHMIVLEGPQGIFKSSSLREIAGEHHAEQHENITHKDFLQNLQGKWLIEISEMDSFNRSETSKVKAVITTTSDNFRPSYGRRACDHPRQCIFVGTTNHDDWNKDETGARRFWPIACRGDIDLDAIRANRDQLFAEAVHRFKAGESWWEMPAEETKAEQESRYVDDVWTDLISEYIAGSPGLTNSRSSITVTEILSDCLKFEKAKIGKLDQMRVATCLRRIGWEKGKKERVGRVVTPVWRQKP